MKQSLTNHKDKLKVCFLIILLLPLFLAGCKKEKDPGFYQYSPPEQLDDDWNVSTLSEVGIQTSVIEEIAINIILGEYRGIHSLLIVRNGSLVFEEYFGDYGKDNLQEIFSITKSVSSSLVGIAIDQEFIQGVDDTVICYFPEYTLTDPSVKELKLKHILSLTTGMNWDEKTYPYEDQRNSEYQMFQTEDWFRFVLERPYSFPPGEVYNYNTGAVHLLSSIIKKSTGYFADEFAEEYLFEPLGITDYEWNTDKQGFPNTGATHGGLRMKARDVAKYGYLYLNGGRWRDKQIIPEEWIDESITPGITIDQDTEYGYLWMIKNHVLHGKKITYYLTTGSGGQTLIVMPAYDLVILFLCWNNRNDADIQIPTILILNAINN